MPPESFPRPDFNPNAGLPETKRPGVCSICLRPDCTDPSHRPEGARETERKGPEFIPWERASEVVREEEVSFGDWQEVPEPKMVTLATSSWVPLESAEWEKRLGTDEEELVLSDTKRVQSFSRASEKTTVALLLETKAHPFILKLHASGEMEQIQLWVQGDDATQYSNIAADKNGCVYVTRSEISKEIDENGDEVETGTTSSVLCIDPSGKISQIQDATPDAPCDLAAASVSKETGEIFFICIPKGQWADTNLLRWNRYERSPQAKQPSQSSAHILSAPRDILHDVTTTNRGTFIRTEHVLRRLRTNDITIKTIFPRDVFLRKISETPNGDLLISTRTSRYKSGELLKMDPEGNITKLAEREAGLQEALIREDGTLFGIDIEGIGNSGKLIRMKSTDSEKSKLDGLPMTPPITRKF